MENSNKKPKAPKGSGKKGDPDVKILVDENGEPVIKDIDPEIVPPPEEELEVTPPYEPPPPAEGP